MIAQGQFALDIFRRYSEWDIYISSPSLWYHFTMYCILFPGGWSGPFNWILRLLCVYVTQYLIHLVNEALFLRSAPVSLPTGNCSWCLSCLNTRQCISHCRTSVASWRCLPTNLWTLVLLSLAQHLAHSHVQKCFLRAYKCCLGTLE